MSAPGNSARALSVSVIVMLVIISSVAFLICRMMYRVAKAEEAALERAGLAPTSESGAEQ